MGRAQLRVEGLSAFRAADKLSRAGIFVFSVKNIEKTAVLLEVASKDLEKAFAIFHSSCYNVTRVRYRGAAKILRLALSRIGLFVALALFLVAVFFFEGRLLRIRVEGSGAYYEREVIGILEEEGARSFAPHKDFSGAKAKILALPGVSFCSLAFDGGILTVDVEISREEEGVKGNPLAAPVSGILAELVVVRGTPCFSVGDSVEAGQTVVECNGGIVIAAAKFRFAFEKEYEGSEEGARAKALLEAGTLRDITAEKTDKGYLIRGTGEVTANVNLP